MITNFLFPSKTALGDIITFSNKSNKYNIYIKEQNDEINTFNNNLIDDIYKHVLLLKSIKKENIKGVIKKNIWKLWNKAYALGYSHADKEVIKNFNSAEELVKFNEIDKRVLREESITRNTEITELEKKEFGRIYLEKRIDYLGDDLKQEYKLELLRPGGIIDRFFKNKSPAKSKILKEEIKQLVIQSEALRGERTVEDIKNQDRIFRRIKGNIPVKEDYYDEYRTNLENTGIYSDEEIDRKVNLLKKKPYNPIVNLTTEDRFALGLDGSRQYTLKSLTNAVNKNKEVITNKTNRLALTELGHAYNLGRLEYYSEKNIELVKLNNSLEHLRRIFPNNYKSIYENVARDVGYPFQIRGVVCPKCQERAVRDSGYGKGIYLLSDVLTNRELQLVFHPYCACYYEPVDESDRDKKKRKIKTRVNSLFDNTLLKWSAGGAAAILGTGLMYLAFNKYLKNKKISIKPKINNINLEAPKVNLPKLPSDIVDIIVENSDDITQAIINNSSILELPLKPLKNTESIDIPQQQEEEVNNLLNNTETDYNANNIINNINKVISNANDEIINSNNINLSINNELNEEINNIQNRLNDYLTYNSQNLSKTEQRLVINSFKQDIRRLNSILNNIETTNFTLYTKLKSLEKAKEEALKTIESRITNIPLDINKQDYYESFYQVRRINDTIDNTINKLREINGLYDLDSYQMLKNLREDIESNPELLKEFINSSRTQINNNFNKIDNIVTNIYNRELKELEDIINSGNIGDVRRRQLLVELEVISYQIERRLKAFTYTLGDLNLEYLSLDLNVLRNEVLENNLLGKAVALNDYKKLLIETQKKIFVLTNKILLK